MGKTLIFQVAVRKFQYLIDKISISDWQILCLCKAMTVQFGDLYFLGVPPKFRLNCFKLWEDIQLHVSWGRVILRAHVSSVKIFVWKVRKYWFLCRAMILQIKDLYLLDNLPEFCLDCSKWRKDILLHVPWGSVILRAHLSLVKIYRLKGQKI